MHVAVFFVCIEFHRMLVIEVLEDFDTLTVAGVQQQRRFVCPWVHKGWRA